MKTPEDDDADDDFLGQIGALGATINASRNDSLDPELRDVAGSAAETAVGHLADEHRRGGRDRWMVRASGTAGNAHV
ncbi:hypothetical protein ACFV47_10950 [Streptomyces solisilvae]|uniref:hypothetical protein n=1 Tax=Streptomyces malaysiensis TaxID=92644 RepID=UPI00369540E3